MSLKPLFLLVLMSIIVTSKLHADVDNSFLNWAKQQMNYFGKDNSSGKRDIALKEIASTANFIKEFAEAPDISDEQRSKAWEYYSGLCIIWADRLKAKWRLADAKEKSYQSFYAIKKSLYYNPANESALESYGKAILEALERGPVVQSMIANVLDTNLRRELEYALELIYQLPEQNTFKPKLLQRLEELDL